MKGVIIALGIFVLYSCSSTAYHQQAKKMIIQMPNQRKEKNENKPKFSRYQIFTSDVSKETHD